MLQVIQDLKTGRLTVEEVPPPSLPPEGVLVRNVCSLISPGTEIATIKIAQASLLNKARQRPELTRQVLDNIKKEGLLATLRKVQTRLSVPKALGYSCAGYIIASSCDEFRPGERVACAGQDYASHAEIVAVPKNLVCPLPPMVSFEEGAFATLGAIALHGVRQLEPRLNETIAVIGLGLIGLLTVQILKANGCKVVGLDITNEALERARRAGADEVFLVSDHEFTLRILEFTQGLGVDGVIIAASTTSNEPVKIAAALCRDRGRIVILGKVKADLPHQLFYERELEVRFSRSYGPGRYDPFYEEKGIDYPIGYVRWTEKRNLAAFLDLVAAGKIRPRELITHQFPIEEAAQAYELLRRPNKEGPGAVLFLYGNKPNASPEKVVLSGKKKDSESILSKTIKNIGIIGSGHHAQAYILPRLKENSFFHLHTLVDINHLLALTMAKKFGYTYASADPRAVIENPEIEAAVIATRHNSHASLVKECLRMGKKVFVEKPLAINETELQEIEVYLRDNPNSYLMVGFNRRFSKPIRLIRTFFHPIRPLILHYRVSAGPLPPGHWLLDPTQGGRFVGEGGHFIDTIKFITGAEIVSVYARAIYPLVSPFNSRDNLSCLFQLSDGSVASLDYFETGGPSFPKERLEVFGGGRAASLEDFRQLILAAGRKIKKYRFRGEKGHAEEMDEVLKTWREGKPSPIPYQSLLNTTRATLKVNESLSSGQAIKVTS